MKYHLKRKDRKITDDKKIQSILKRGKYATLALCKDNIPYAVTLSYGYSAEANCLYFHGSDSGQKIDFIQANSNVCLTIINDKGTPNNFCGHEYSSLVIMGNATIVTNENERIHAIDVMLEHFNVEASKMKAKVKPDSEPWQRTTIIKVSIEELTGKERSEVLPK